MAGPPAGVALEQGNASFGDEAQPALHLGSREGRLDAFGRVKSKNEAAEPFLSQSSDGPHNPGLPEANDSHIVALTMRLPSLQCPKWHSMIRGVAR